MFSIMVVGMISVLNKELPINADNRRRLPFYFLFNYGELINMGKFKLSQNEMEQIASIIENAVINTMSDNDYTAFGWLAYVDKTGNTDADTYKLALQSYSAVKKDVLSKLDNSMRYIVDLALHNIIHDYDSKYFDSSYLDFTI